MLDDRLVAGLRAFAANPGPEEAPSERFELREVIGEGGMGIVYGAWDRELGREVALKVLRTSRADEVARFERECGALAGVDHPCLVTYVAHGTHGVVSWVAMEKLVGESLSVVLRRGPLTIAGTLALGRRIGDALSAVHASGITHRDVKPSNVFLVGGAPDNVRLLDFGIAREVGGPVLTQLGALVGTPGYLAPEQARGEVATPAADVFALGALLFECLVGRPAFTGSTTETLLAKVMLESPVLVRAERRDAPLGLEALVEQMLDKNAAARPTAAVVERELAGFEAASPVASMAVAPEKLAPGVAEGTVIVGKYRVERRIGEGGMGIVLEARHLELGRRVALKLLRRGEFTDEPRFLQEARAVSRIESEHVARVLDVGRTDDGTPFIVMEHLSGTDLARRLVESGPLPVAVAVGYVLEASEAIAEAHALGIVHRDLKPSNLFVAARRDGSHVVKVLDFGISKMTRSLEDLSLPAAMTGASAVIGSAAYMSPEQLYDAKQVDHRADIWALGIVLHELVTGSRPFEGESAAAIGARIATSPPRRLREHSPGAPEELERVILECLEKDRETRIANLSVLARALLPFAGEGHRSSVDRIVRMVGGVEGAPRPATSSPSSSASRGTAWRRPAIVAVIAAVAMVAVFALSRSGSRGDAVGQPSAASVVRGGSPTVTAERPAASAGSPTASASGGRPSVPTHATGVTAATPAAAARASGVSPIGASPAPRVQPLPPPLPSLRPAGLDLRDPALERR